LLRLAALEPANEQVPYAFEKGIMAQIRGLRIEDPLSEWASAFWKACIPCVGLAAVTFVLVLSSSPEVPNAGHEQVQAPLVLEDLILAALYDEGGPL